MTTKIEVFSTDGCPHCPGAVRMAEEVKQELGDIDLEIVKIDNEENRQRAVDYGIMAVPTIVINNNVEFTGAPAKEDLIARIKSL
ncbi:MAG: MJ0307 family thioredoxin [Methanobacteriaceae archaeon]|jgi:small redox-active disulfide protein 1|nr:MJ0307 family thioredoxin [Methanobacteriaceae archaeon]